MLLFAGARPIGGFWTGLLVGTTGVSTAIAVNAAACLIGVLIGLAYYVSHRESIAPRELHATAVS